MSIKNRSQIIMVLSVGLVIAASASLLFISGRYKQANEQRDIATEVVRGVFELNILTNDYLLTNNKRAQTQWSQRHESLSQLLTANAWEGFGDLSLIDDIQGDNEKLRTAFFDLVALQQSSPTVGGDATASASMVLVTEKESRLIGNTTISSQSMVSKASRVAEIAEKVTAQTRDWQNGITTVAIVMLTLVIIINAWLMSSVVINRLVNLREIVDLISKGKLDVKLDSKELSAKDEIGDLARAFERTVVSLKLAMRDTGLLKDKDVQASPQDTGEVEASAPENPEESKNSGEIRY